MTWARWTGYHEMWNAWLYACDLAEMASTLDTYRVRIIGYATLTVPKQTFSGKPLDIGVVAEHEDGDRFWCHFSDEDRKRLLEDDL